jgi:hypothetical protein
MRKMTLTLAAILAACSSGTTTTSTGDFPKDALATATSDGGSLHIEVRSSPQPPPRGTCTMQVILTGPSGPADGVDVAVVPWMDAMGHGASVKPSVTAAGGGKYIVSNVSMFMPGTWSLRLTFSGAVNDKATVPVDVP